MADELTATVCGAIHQLNHASKAKFLLDTALALIDAGKYGPDVENYLEVYLKTPGLSPQERSKALLARGNARKRNGELLIAKAEQDFQAVAKLDPNNRQIQQHMRRRVQIHFSREPASQRAPLEIWERIASHTPRFYLRNWLFISSLHRDIAVRYIFHTVDIYIGEDQDNLNKGLDIFDRVKADPVFANRIKILRLHWAIEEGDMLDLLTRIFKSSLPEFKALREFEWIGYPELQAEMVQVLLKTHRKLHSLGSIGFHFDASGVSAFRHLRKFTLRAEDDDGFADMSEVRSVLDANEHTLRHLVLGASLERQHSWDLAFQSSTIKNLTHLDLVDTKISHIVLARIAHAHNLQSLTLHGTLEEPASARVVFGSDQIIDGQHTFLPHLEAFRFILVGHPEDVALYQSVVQFLRHRRGLRRLDLGSCPWETTVGVLPELTGLRVLGVKIPNLSPGVVDSLVNSLPRELMALSVSMSVSDQSLHEHAHPFRRFHQLSFLHFKASSKRRPKPNLLSDKDYREQTNLWNFSARSLAASLPSLDFLGWHGEHYIVVRGKQIKNDVGYKTGSKRLLEGWDCDTDRLDSVVGNGDAVDLKELPSRRRLDCLKGVDLGSEDAAWLERIDVPMDFEAPGLS